MYETNPLVVIAGSFAILVACLVIGSKIGQSIERRYQTRENALTAPAWVQLGSMAVTAAIGFGLAYLLL